MTTPTTMIQQSSALLSILFFFSGGHWLLASFLLARGSSGHFWVAAAEANVINNDNDKNDTNKCGIYLAPSTIPGAGMGMFAGHYDFAQGDYLADGDLVIPAYELKFHVGHNQFDFLWEEYTWKAASFFGMKEEIREVKNVKACSPGFGAAVNCILPMVNVKDDFEGRAVSMSGVNASTSPGAGAFTIYHNRRWKAKRHIPAGMELYGNYGSGYFRTRPDYGPIPLLADYKTADELLKLYRLIVKNKDPIDIDSNNNTTHNWKTDLLNILTGMQDIWDDSRAMHAIPKVTDMATIEWLLAPGRGSGYQHYNTSIRSVEWLEEHGRCMDKIKDGVSTIPHAGRGAFASRFIATGDLVAPAPLIHIPDRDIFTIYAEKTKTVKKSNGTIVRKSVANHDKPLHYQLLLNYCFGHGDSSLLLCPYGLLTSNINHDGHDPNTRIQWSAKSQMAHPEWLDQPIDEWGKKEKAGLSFDFVALRDIQPGDEITVDYGDDWATAWNEHTQQFSRSSSKRKPYTPGFELNEMVDLVLPTINEEGFNGVNLFCHRDHLRLAGMSDFVSSETSETDWLEKPVHPCRILLRTRNGKDGHSYTAEITDTKVIVFDLPRDAFYFADKIYERPHHRYFSFRHEMRIPEDMFPKIWRNQKTEAKPGEQEL
ncbi:MAG: hypothetical protein SGILL_010111 [Bacillariaceae sp.]